MATIYTSDGEISRNFTSKCEISMVGINVPIQFQWPFIVLWMEIFFWDHAMHGTEGVHFFTKLKQLNRWPKSIKSGPEFVIPTN